MWQDNQTKVIYETHSELRASTDKLLPEVITDEVIEQLDVTPVKQVVPPSYDPIYKTLLKLSPTVVDGVLTQCWDLATHATEVAEANLAAAKAAKRNLINVWRLAANNGTFKHQGKEFSCDSLSRSDIDGTTSSVLLSGDFPAGWPGGWKAVDNTYITISTVDQWKEFVASMSAAGTANFARAQVLKSNVNTATTTEQLDKIQWGA